MTGVPRRPAFDPSALDELDGLLPPPVAAASGPAAAATGSAAAASSPPAREEKNPRTARIAAPREMPDKSGGGVGSSTADALRTVAVRIPRELYEALNVEVLGTMREKPSYAQLITWTIEDHRADALSEIEDQVLRHRRAPRGRKMATDAVAMAPRFRPDELAVLEGLIEEAGGVSRTDAVIATFRVALRQAD